MAAITIELLESAKRNLLAQQKDIEASLNKILGALELIEAQTVELSKPDEPVKQ